jgi:hypothetical protein
MLPRKRMAMAGQDGGESINLTVEILKGIRTDLAELRRDLNQGLVEVRQEIGGEIKGLRSDVDKVAQRLGQVIEEKYDHEARLRVVEKSLGLR